MDGYSSDHYPVDFHSFPMRAGPVSIGSYSNQGEGERVLDIYQNQSANGRWPGVYRRTGAINQKWTVQDRSFG